MVGRRSLLVGSSAGLVTVATGPTLAGAQGSDAATLAAAYIAAFSAHDPAAAGDLLAADAIYLDMTIGEPQIGRDTIRAAVIDPYLKAVPDLQWEMRGAPVAAGDRVAFEWRISGRNTGAWPEEVPPSGRAFSLEGVTVMQVRDGLIATVTDYYDGLSFQSQLGWVE